MNPHPVIHRLVFDKRLLKQVVASSLIKQDPPPDDIFQLLISGFLIDPGKLTGVPPGDRAKTVDNPVFQILDRGENVFLFHEH